MILNNYWAIKGYTLNNGPVASSSYATVDIGLKDLSGNTAGFPYQVNGSNTSYIFPNWIALYNASAKVGTGTAQPDADDYDIDIDCTSSFSNFTVTVNANAGDGELTTVATISGINTSGSDVTISEVLIYRELYNPTIPMPSNQPKIAIVHEKLSSPIAVPNGSGFSLILSWKEK